MSGEGVSNSVGAGRPLVGGRAAFALAVATGLLYFVGFPGVNIWPAALVAMGPLAIALRGQRPRRAALLGWTSGFTMTMCGFYWLLEMLRTFSGFPTPVCFVFMAILCAYQGGRIGLFGWLHARAEERGWPAAAVFFAAFAASELLWPLLFPWYLSAATHRVPALAQLGEVGGPYLVGLVVAAPGLAIAEIVAARLAGRPAPRGIAVGCVLVPVAAAAWGAMRMRQVDARVRAAPRARVGIVQGDMPLVHRPHDRSEGLVRHLRLTRDLVAGGADLVVWSEATISYHVPENDAERAVRVLLSYARLDPRGDVAGGTPASGLGAPVVFGTIVERRGEDRRHYFNSALAVDAAGRLTGRYDKQYRLAFGEYLPLGETFPVLYDWSPHSGRLDAGDSIEPVAVDGRRATVLICYEDILPSFVNAAVRRGDPDVLLNLTNDAWFGDSTEPWIHLALSQMRAVEHRRFLVRATNSGVSAIVDPAGRVTVHGGTFRQEALRGEIAWLHGRTPYEVVGDAPWWIVAAAAVFAAFRRPPLPGRAVQGA